MQASVAVLVARRRLELVLVLAEASASVAAARKAAVAVAVVGRDARKAAVPAVGTVAEAVYQTDLAMDTAAAVDAHTPVEPEHKDLVAVRMVEDIEWCTARTGVAEPRMAVAGVHKDAEHSATVVDTHMDVPSSLVQTDHQYL